MEYKRPGGPLIYKPVQWPDGVWRNPYEEPETPTNVRNPAAMEHFNNLVIRYYDALRHNREKEAQEPISTVESAMRMLNFSEMPKSEQEIEESYRGFVLYAHPDKVRYLNISQYSEASEVITKRLNEAREYLKQTIS